MLCQEELAEFMGFVRSRSHILLEYPAALFQEVLNEPDASPLSNIALRWRKRQPPALGWIERLNKREEADRPMLTLRIHPDRIRKCGFSPDDGKIWSIHARTNEWETRTSTWRTLTGERIPDDPPGRSPFEVRGQDIIETETGRTLIHAEETLFLRSPGDRFIALVSRKDGSATLLSTRSWTPQCRFPSNWYEWLRESAWSPDEYRIAVVHFHGMDGAGRRRFSVRLWEIEGGRLGAELPLGEEPRALLWSRDGRSLAAIGLGEVTVWEAPDWKKAAEWPVESTAACGDISPDGQTIALGSDPLRIRRLRTGETVWETRPRRQWYVGCRFSHDGRLLLTASDDGALRLWDLDRSRKEAAENPANEACLISPGHRELLCKSKDEWEIALVDPITAQPLRKEENGDLSDIPLAYSPDGERVIFGRRGQLTLIETRTWEEDTGWETADRFQGHGYDVHAAVFLPEGRRILSGGGDWNFGELKLWDAVSGREIASVESFLKAVKGCACSPDGRILAAASTGLSLWSVSGAPIRGLSPDRPFSKCAFSPDGRTILGAGAEGKLSLWRVRSGDVVRDWPAHAGGVLRCGFLDDGRTILSLGLLDSLVKIWDVDGPGCRAQAQLPSPPVGADWTGTGEPVVMPGFEGGLYLYRWNGTPAGPLWTTAVVLYRFRDGDWEERPTGRCGKCGKLFPVPGPILEALRGIQATGPLDGDSTPCLELAEEAWDEPRLRSDCPGCGHPLRYNPFIVDERGRSGPPPTE